MKKYTAREVKTALRKGYFLKKERLEFIDLLQKDVLSNTTLYHTIRRMQTQSRFIDLYTATLLMGIEAGLRLQKEN